MQYLGYIPLIVGTAVFANDIPPKQTHAQKTAFIRIATTAAHASNVSESDTIALIGSSAVQLALSKVAPQLTSVDPGELWERYWLLIVVCCTFALHVNPSWYIVRKALRVYVETEGVVFLNKTRK